MCNKSLGDLEEVTVGLIGSKFCTERLGLISTDFCTGRYDSEGILNHLSGRPVENIQQVPVNFYREPMLVLQGNLTPFAKTSTFGETEVDILCAELNITRAGHRAVEHFLMEDYLARIINGHFKISSVCHQNTLARSEDSRVSRFIRCKVIIHGIFLGD